MLSAADAATVADAVARYADNPSGFLALGQDNEYFTASDGQGITVYRRSGRYLVQFAAPFAPARSQAKVLDEFLAFAASLRCRVMAVQLQRQDTDLYGRSGFSVNQMGASYAVDLTTFSLRGRSFVQLRNKISRAKRAGVEVSEVAPAQVEEDLRDIDQEWLRGKGRHVRPLRFLVGEHGGPVRDQRRVFVGRVDGTVVGYISYSPAYGERPGWLYDLSRRRREVPPGVMEAINVAAIDEFRSTGARWLHFGFTPFVGLDPALEPAAASPIASKIIRFLSRHGEFVYPAATQVSYKEKWGPQIVLPEYIAFQGHPRLGAIWQLLRLTNAV